MRAPEHAPPSFANLPAPSRATARPRTDERQLSFAWAATPAERQGSGPAALRSPACEAPVRAHAAARLCSQEHGTACASAELEEQARAWIEGSMADGLGMRVAVELTTNRRTMISTRRVGDALRVRLHHMFVEADAPVLEALRRYVQHGDRRASRRLADFIESRRARFVAPRPPASLRPKGQHHDLAAIFEELERRWFPGALAGVAITWGRAGAARKRRRKRTIRLGTYTHDERLIRVHPVLDRAWVPRFFVSYIVFHEMLHHVEPAREQDGRTIFHTPEFRRRERAFPDYERAIAWERANIDRLLAG